MSEEAIITHSEAEEAMRQSSPSFFRSQLVIDIEGQGKAVLGEAMDDWQAVEFDALDPAMLWLAGYEKRKPEVTRFWWQRARGHSKTGDVAAELTWLLYGAKWNLVGIVGAEDKEQAKLVRDSMQTIAEDNPWLFERLDYQRHSITNKETGASITIISSDVASSWGAKPHLVVCDEFTHWTKQAFWHSMFSSFGKKQGVLIVACNAGAGRDWKWKARETARTRRGWRLHSPEGCIASWIAQETLDEQRSVLPPSEYARLWENKWQETGGEFVSLQEAEACRDPMLQMAEWGVEGWQYIAAVDFAEKRDYTVGGVGHVCDHKIILDRMDTIVPRPGQPTRVSWVKNWMQNVQESFQDVRFIIDKFQLLAVAEELGELGFEIEEFDFASGIGNYEMGVALRQCILHRKVLWYPGCGAIEQPWGRDDLETELASLIVEVYSNGRRWRFNHLPDDTHHDDRSFVVGAICLHCVKGLRDGYEYFGLIPPAEDGGFRWAAA